MLPGVIESSMLMTSATSGPLLGVFLLAMLVPCANWKGAAIGMVVSHLTSMWLTFGHLSVRIRAESLPLSIDGCTNDTFSSHLTRPIPLNLQPAPSTTPVLASAPNDTLEFLYSITYMYYALIGSMTTVIVGIAISLLTANPKEDAYEEHLLHPLALRLSKSLPGTPRFYAESRKLGDEHDATNPGFTASMTSVENGDKSSHPGGVEINGKVPQGRYEYMRKLNALKDASLEVTREVDKGTRL